MEGYVRIQWKGFTFLELMVVIVIIGILAVVAIPSMRDPVERSRAKNAEFNLIAVYSAQKRHLVAHRAYFTCSDIADADDRLRAINENLSLKIDDPYFEYNIRPDNDGYVAWAMRKDGTCVDKNMSVTEDNSTVNKTGCSAW